MALRLPAFLISLLLFIFDAPSVFAGETASDNSIQFYVATFGSAPIDAGMPTHVLIAGVGDHVGLQFQESAVGQAVRIRDVFPQDQILLLFFNERADDGEDALLRRWGLTVIRRAAEEFTQQQLMSELVAFSRIRSIDVYAHSWTDFARLTPSHKFEDDENLKALAWHFTDDAYAIFHGCSAGWGLAADVSKRWVIPVAGALAGTNFEQLHSSGNFYFNDEATKPPGPWAVENAISFSSRRPCRDGGCLRMKPDNKPYDGVHGKLLSGLPFYKFFCSPDDLDRIRCLRGMAMSVYTQIDLSTLKDGDRHAKYKTAVQNLLCPIEKVSALREDCRKELQKAEKTGNLEYSPFAGPTATCDWEGCRAPWVWEKTQAFAGEYYHYLNAYELIAGRIPNGLEP